MSNDGPITLLKSPAEAAAWRRGLPPGPDAVAVVAGAFEILQPGNLAALAAIPANAAPLVAVEPAPAAAYPPEARLAALTFLRRPAAVTLPRSDHLDPFFQALAPYTWTDCPLPDAGPGAEAARRHAAAIRELPRLPGCRTAEIRAAAKAGRTPIPLPADFPLPPLPSETGTPAATVNGCFDILHLGHFQFLEQAAAQAGAPVTLLVNSDASIRRYKGAGRPVFPFAFRRAALLALRSVREVLPFDEDEPLALLARLRPPLHIKGGSREPDRVRREEALLASWGGRVAFCPLTEGYSTSSYLARIHNTDRS